jgi:FkbM family methyltransferase
MKPLFKKTVENLAKRQGYLITPTWRAADLPLENHLKSIFEKYEISTVLDVGANIGQYYDFLRNRVGFDGTIHSFEPIPELFNEMSARSKNDKLWKIHNIGLGSENTVLEFNVMAHSVFSSFLKPDNTATEKFSESNSIQRVIKVPVRKLDDYLPSIGLNDLNGVYLKVDTQGFDREVFGGSLGTLGSIKALQFELAIQRIYKGVPDFLDMLKFIGEFGFDISGMFPITSDEHLRALEFDCLMVKQP